MVLLQSLPFKSQNGDVFSKAFILETRLTTSPIFVINYFQIWFTSTDMAKESITWMTIIRVTESTLWQHRKPYVSYLDQTKVEIHNVLITGEFCNPWSTILLLRSMHQCCIISTFESSVFNYLLWPFAWLWSTNLRSSSFP